MFASTRRGHGIVDLPQLRHHELEAEETFNLSVGEAAGLSLFQLLFQNCDAIRELRDFSSTKSDGDSYP